MEQCLEKQGSRGQQLSMGPLGGHDGMLPHYLLPLLLFREKYGSRIGALRRGIESQAATPLMHALGGSPMLIMAGISNISSRN